MKRFKLALIFSLAFLPQALSSRALAGPVWADMIARSHCEYLAMGINWKKSIEMALSDNSTWMSELTAAGNHASTIILYSITSRCNNLNTEAYNTHKQTSGGII
jgi:hypothetical protein